MKYPKIEWYVGNVNELAKYLSELKAIYGTEVSARLTAEILPSLTDKIYMNDENQSFIIAADLHRLHTAILYGSFFHSDSDYKAFCDALCTFVLWRDLIDFYIKRGRKAPQPRKSALEAFCMMRVQEYKILELAYTTMSFYCSDRCRQHNHYLANRGRDWKVVPDDSAVKPANRYFKQCAIRLEEINARIWEEFEKQQQVQKTFFDMEKTT